ncbi:hypothetical protein LUZ60_015574 [Juncus effusus]|nr:hypothetical protein LUZ60_015574 [Juncus effusus]
MEGLRVAKADLTVYIHPSMSADVSTAVRRQLSSLLFTYDELFDGVVLSHECSIQDEKAKILPGLTPYFGVKTKAKLLLFSPKPDMILEGKVVKIGRDSIHAVVLGFASAAIMSYEIRNEFKYKEEIEGEGAAFASSKHEKHSIKIGSMIRFLVKSVDEEIIHVNGSLSEQNTGCIKWLSKHASDDTHDRSKKRQKDSYENGDQFEGRAHKSRKIKSEE